MNDYIKSDLFICNTKSCQTTPVGIVKINRLQNQREEVKPLIPKVIHYCWFGGKPLDKLGQKCLESWKKYFSDYEIREWNENNFDVNCCRYIKEAYEAKKWAFVSDYVRFKILYEHGGVYFDTDVEAIKPFDKILSAGNFMGCERGSDVVAPGLGMAVAPGLDIIKEILDDYERSSFIKSDGALDLTTIVERTTKILKRHGLSDTDKIQTIEGIRIYPPEYFCPINMETGKLTITPNTYSIHRFAGSWEKKSSKFRGKVYRFINRVFGKSVASTVKNTFGRKKRNNYEQ